VPLPTTNSKTSDRLIALVDHLAAETEIEWSRHPAPPTDNLPVGSVQPIYEIAGERMGNFGDAPRTQVLQFYIQFRSDRINGPEVQDNWSEYLIQEVFKDIQLKGVGPSKAFRGLVPYGVNTAGVFVWAEAVATNTNPMSGEGLILYSLRFRYSYTIAGAVQRI